MAEFAKGQVDHINSRENEIVVLADGWTAQRVFSDRARDAFLKFGENGATIPWHRHIQREHLYVVTGRVLLEVDGQAPSEMVMGDAAIIPPNVPHRLTARADGDTWVMAIFEPPISLPMGTVLDAEQVKANPAGIPTEPEVGSVP